MQAIGRTTEWHEGHDKFQGARNQKKVENNIKEELVFANQELKKLRNAKLVELYREEN